MENNPQNSKTSRAFNLTAVVLFFLGLSSLGSSNILSAAIEPNRFIWIWMVTGGIYLVAAFFVWKRDSAIACLIGLVTFLLGSLYSFYLSYLNFGAMSQLVGQTTAIVTFILNVGFVVVISFLLWGGYQHLKQGKSK